MSRLLPSPHQIGLDRTRGLTLVEMTVSLVIIGVILLGLGSTMLVASKAMPVGPAHGILLGAEAAERISAELPYAVSVSYRSLHAVEFTVADRNGDAVPETIRYEWSGVVGNPLTRRYNGGAAVSVLDAVETFDLMYDLDTVTTEVPQSNESGVSLLKSFQAVDDSQDYTIKSDRWYGQYFKPTLPADTVNWRVTRVEFYARYSGIATGACKVQIQSPTAGNLPSGVVLQETTLMEYTLTSNYLKQSFAFNADGLAPDQGLCLVFRWADGTEACQIQGDNNLGSPVLNSTLVKSTDLGASWSTYPTESLRYAIYGTVASPGQPQIEQTLYLSAVDVTVRAGADTTAQAVTGIRLLNRPEVQP